MLSHCLAAVLYFVTGCVHISDKYTDIPELEAAAAAEAALPLKYPSYPPVCNSNRCVCKEVDGC